MRDARVELEQRLLFVVDRDDHAEQRELPRVVALVGHRRHHGAVLRDRALPAPSSRARARIVEILRFAAVGAAQNLLNVGLFAVGVASGLPYLLAAILAGAVALGASFIAN